MISLDTNAVIAAINRRLPSVRPRLEAAIVAGEPVGISAIVLFELRYGIIKSALPQENRAILEAFLALDVTPWPFEPEDAEEAGEIRAELERLGRPAADTGHILEQIKRVIAEELGTKPSKITPNSRLA